MRKLFIFFCILGFVSCKSLRPSVMFRTPENYQYAADTSTSTTTTTEYKLAVDDLLELRIYTNDGFKLVDITNFSAGATTSLALFAVEPDGYVRLPTLGRTMLKGLTVRQCETLLEEKYSAVYLRPYIKIKVTNRRVIVFTGNGGGGTVVNLPNDNTTLIEALALAGGINVTGKSYKIKIIRGDLRNPEIHLVDLSTVEGMKKADLVLQSKDIVYVEPVKQLDQKFIQTVTPLIGFISSVFVIYTIVKAQ